MPSPELFGHADAYGTFTRFASELEAAGLVAHFPQDTDLRHAAIELLAEREHVDNVVEDPTLIMDAIEEARGILEDRRRRLGQ
jgi:hypothetical protein